MFDLRIARLAREELRSHTARIDGNSEDARRPQPTKSIDELKTESEDLDNTLNSDLDGNSGLDGFFFIWFEKARICRMNGRYVMT